MNTKRDNVREGIILRHYFQFHLGIINEINVEQI